MPSSPRLTVRVTSAAIAGAAAGLGMAGWFAATGYPFRLFAATILGDSALLPSAGWGYDLTGLLVHLALSAFLGAIFGGLVHERRSVKLLALALLYSAAVGFAMRFVLLPEGMNLALLARVPAADYLTAHLVFGALLGLLVRPIERRFERPALATVHRLEPPILPPREHAPPPLRRVA